MLCSQSPPSDIALTFASPSDVPVATTVHDSEIESEDVVDPTAPDENGLAVISDESMLGGDHGVIHLQIQQQGEVEDPGNGDGCYFLYFCKSVDTPNSVSYVKSYCQRSVTYIFNKITKLFYNLHFF